MTPPMISVDGQRVRVRFPQRCLMTPPDNAHPTDKITEIVDEWGSLLAADAGSRARAET